VGNGTGTSAATRSNAFVVLQNGNVGIGTDTPSDRLVVNGNMSATGDITSNAFLLSSDRRLKTNIRSLYSEWDNIMKLNPVSYQKRESLESENYDRFEYGFIAQELELIYPELVKTNSEGLKFVDYTSMIPILTKGMQSLILENKRLTEQVEQQEDQISDLNKRLDELTELINSLIENK
jgi:hypothetical protein